MTAVGMERVRCAEAGLQVEQQVDSLLAQTSPAKARLARIRTRGATHFFAPAMAERPDRALDLWVIGQEVARFDLP